MGLGQETGVQGRGGLRGREGKLDSCPGWSAEGCGNGREVEWVEEYECFLFRIGTPQRITPFRGPRLGLALTVTMKEGKMSVNTSRRVG